MGLAYLEDAALIKTENRDGGVPLRELSAGSTGKRYFFNERRRRGAAASLLR